MSWAQSKFDYLVNGIPLEERFPFDDSSSVEDSSPTPPKSPVAVLPGINKITSLSFRSIEMPSKN